MADYEVKFSELARFAPEYVNIEAKKAKKIQERFETRDSKSGNYLTECPSGAGKPDLTYFKCGKVGHMEKNCKEPVQKTNVLRNTGPSTPVTSAAQPRERTFNMTMQDVVWDVDVVAGTLVINLVEVRVLMDSRATRSFSAESVIDRLKCATYPLEPNLIREVVSQERDIANRIGPNCDMVTEGRQFFANLIHFKLGEFDVLLGMDWLSNHDVQIECRSKKVKLETKDGIEVILKGKKQEKKFLTAMQMKRLLQQGCGAYLAHVKDVEKESFKIEDILVVKYFPDQSPDELPRISPDR
ncbi:uncharacterized protein LOC141703268 [Apium graveolens]|uniref:uncharacterized protein LOC141703268 n=1 Tax=Apium graveolens TaxID=4045 RepID=UPI003D7AC4B4